MLVARIIPSHDLCPKCWIQVFSLWVPATVCRTKRSCCLRTFCCLYESCFINNLCSIHSNYFIIFCSTLTMHLKTALMSVYISITYFVLFSWIFTSYICQITIIHTVCRLLMITFWSAAFLPLLFFFYLCWFLRFLSGSLFIINEPKFVVESLGSVVNLALTMSLFTAYMCNLLVILIGLDYGDLRKVSSREAYL